MTERMNDEMHKLMLDRVRLARKKHCASILSKATFEQLVMEDEYHTLAAKTLSAKLRSIELARNRAIKAIETKPKKKTKINIAPKREVELDSDGKPKIVPVLLSKAVTSITPAKAGSEKYVKSIEPSRFAVHKTKVKLTQKFVMPMELPTEPIL